MSAGRNDPCPCNSGKKYKNCCMLNPAKTASAGKPVGGNPLGGNPLGGNPLGGLLQTAVSCCDQQQWAQAELCCQQVLKLDEAIAALVGEATPPDLR